MAALITEATGEAVDLVKSKGGEFTVWLDGDLLAKKTMMGGFPTEDEILAQVKARLG